MRAAVAHSRIGRGHVRPVPKEEPVSSTASLITVLVAAAVALIVVAVVVRVAPRSD